MYMYVPALATHWDHMVMVPAWQKITCEQHFRQESAPSEVLASGVPVVAKFESSKFGLWAEHAQFRDRCQSLGF